MSVVLTETRGAVALIALNRPDSLNSFNAELREALVGALKAADADEAVRVIVLTGEGRAFSAGADLKDAKPGRDVRANLMDEYKPIADAIVGARKPVIAAVNGAAAGIGSAFAMACDLAVMEEDAYFYLAFANIGLIPDGGAHWRLLRALGHKRAYELIVTAGRLTAPEALAAGLCNRVVPNGQGKSAALDWAEQLAKGAPRTLRFAKEVLTAAATDSFDQSFAREAELQAQCVGSKDNANAVAAFFRKEKPVFTGE